MSIYVLPKTPKIDIDKIKKQSTKFLKNETFLGLICLFIAGCIVGVYGSVAIPKYFPSQTQAFLQYFNSSKEEPVAIEEVIKPSVYVSAVAYEQAIIDAAKNVSPSVVSIVISKNLPTYEQQWINPFGDLGYGFQVPQYVQNGIEYQEVGEGSGFIVSADGLVLTNKHVVSDKEADYKVITNEGEEYPAEILALDPVQDLAVIKIQLDQEKQADVKFQPVTLGDSDGIQIGQTAIAIGNSLGQFSNTVSVGVVSGLERTILASDQSGSMSETLEDIIQTDAAINSGNSGGPLLNLRGEVIGINTAMAENAQAVGFAIPINMAKKDIGQVIATNKIVYPFLGVRYVLVDKDVEKEYELSVDYGALILSGDEDGEEAITKGSAAEKAGLEEEDIILEINGEKITSGNSMAKIIQKYNAGDKIALRVLKNGEEQSMEVTLGERSI